MCVCAYLELVISLPLVMCLILSVRYKLHFTHHGVPSLKLNSHDCAACFFFRRKEKKHGTALWHEEQHCLHVIVKFHLWQQVLRPAAKFRFH